MSELEIRKAVKERYAKMATSSDPKCCDQDECCSDSGLISSGEAVPVEASSVGAGCGSPLLLVTPKEGDVVLDLGSGGGIDIFRASQLVGEKGRAIGVDATPEKSGFLVAEVTPAHHDRICGSTILIMNPIRGTMMKRARWDSPPYGCRTILMPLV